MVFLGLDNAGKTTLFGFLSNGIVQTHTPTQRSTSNTLDIYGIKFQAYDVGGHTEAREIWDDILIDATSIVFMIDATERNQHRIKEAQDILNRILLDQRYSNVPILIFGNKIDKAEMNPMSEAEMRLVYGLENTTGKMTKSSNLDGMRPIELFMCSVLRKANLQEGLQWIAAQM